MSGLRLAVIGGINMDILGTPEGEFTPRDSMIGRVVFRAGGVGRNIAAQAKRLEADVLFVTAFGGDETGRTLKNACEADGLDISRALYTDSPSSVYLAIHDENGDMAAAVNDMALLNAMTPQALAPVLPFVNAARACVLDANLPEKTLVFLSQNITVPLLCDPVSCQKAPRVLPILSHLSAFKPNLYEAKALSNRETPQDAAQWLIEKGVQKVFVSLGAQGVYYSDGTSMGFLTPAAISHAPQTGAGDAMTAGLAVSLCEGLPVFECAARGMDAAARHLAQ